MLLLNSRMADEDDGDVGKSSPVSPPPPPCCCCSLSKSFWSLDMDAPLSVDKSLPFKKTFNFDDNNNNNSQLNFGLFFIKFYYLMFVSQMSSKKVLVTKLLLT